MQDIKAVTTLYPYCKNISGGFIYVDFTSIETMLELNQSARVAISLSMYWHM